MVGAWNAGDQVLAAERYSLVQLQELVLGAEEL
jgi:hypothetical protein